jgi:hypothetical protein
VALNSSRPVLLEKLIKTGITKLGLAPWHWFRDIMVNISMRDRLIGSVERRCLKVFDRAIRPF